MLSTRCSSTTSASANGDIANVDASWGHFDYIVCHGIYSGVPQSIRDQILAICRANLAPHGVAYVSYNTLPGWQMRGMVRAMMKYHCDAAPSPKVKVRQSRSLLEFLAQHAVPNTAYNMALRQELDAVQGQPDTYIFHDHLEEINEPCYFHEFADAARRHGLQYLAEANFSQMLISHFGPEAGATLVRVASDVVRMEQYIDFLRNRGFRQTLLVRAEAPLYRKLTGERVFGFYVGSAARFESKNPPLSEGVAASVRAPNGAAIGTSNAVTKVARLIEFRMRPPLITLEASAQPVGSPLARLQLERELPIANLRREPVVLDARGAHLLRLLKWHTRSGNAAERGAHAGRRARRSFASAREVRPAVGFKRPAEGPDRQRRLPAHSAA